MLSDFTAEYSGNPGYAYSAANWTTLCTAPYR